MHIIANAYQGLNLGRVFILFAVSALLSACQPSADVESNLKFAPPSRISQVRAIDRSLLSPSVQLSDGTQIPMQSTGDNTWSGTINVQPNNTYFVSIEWIEALPEGDLVLAQGSQTVDVDADGAEINLFDENYDFNLDLDGDQISNLEERQNNTNPFVHNDQADTSGDGSTNEGDGATGTIDGSTDSDNSDTDQTTENSSAGSTDNGSTSGDTTSGNADSGLTSSGNVDSGSTDNGSTSGDTTSGTADSGLTSGGNVDSGSTDNGSTSGDTTSGNVDSGGSSDTGSSDGQTTDDTTAGSTSGGNAPPDNGDDTSETQTPPTVLIPRISPSNAPAIDGLGATLDGQDNLSGEWESAVQFDDFGARLWVNNLMIDIDADAADGTQLHRWAAMHDGENLYVLVLVDDRGLRESDSINHWDDDSLELFVDGDNSKLTEWGDDDDFQMIIPLQIQSSTDANNEMIGRFSAGPGSSELAIEFSTGPGIGPDGIRLSRWEQDVYEVAIPLDSAGITIGSSFGFEIQINDDDNGALRDSKWGWFHPSRVGGIDTDRTFLDPSVMGTVVLEE